MAAEPAPAAGAPQRVAVACDDGCVRLLWLAAGDGVGAGLHHRRGAQPRRRATSIKLAWNPGGHQIAAGSSGPSTFDVALTQELARQHLRPGRRPAKIVERRLRRQQARRSARRVEATFCGYTARTEGGRVAGPGVPHRFWIPVLVPSVGAKLRIRVMDEDFGKADDEVGTFLVPFDPVLKEEAAEVRWFHLYGLGEKAEETAKASASTEPADACRDRRQGRP